MAQNQRVLSDLNVKVDVDIAEAIRGLKAIQREAKKATQALRELEAADKSAWTFRSGDVIECGGPRNLFRCICSDRETAVFAPTERTSDGWHTEYFEMFAYPNSPELRDTIAREYRVVEVSAGNGGN